MKFAIIILALLFTIALLMLAISLELIAAPANILFSLLLLTFVGAIKLLAVMLFTSDEPKKGV